jgi:DNA-binding transcriptional ArsR family regulator
MRTPAPEPRFARIAAAMADPSRARMLAVLLSGEHRSAGELARAANISPQAASAQLANLIDSHLIVARAQGRHRYFSLADADVAHALEALSLIAERDAVSVRWQSARFAPLKCARKCYGHLAGELGVALYRALLAKNIFAPDATGALALTETGAAWCAALGLDVRAMKNQSARLAYPCMDWSERQDHLAGSVARGLLDLFLEKRWLVASTESRALGVSAQGKRGLRGLLGVEMSI